MGRSPRFGSVRRNLTPISDSLSLRLRLSGLTLLRRTTRRLIKQKAHRHTCPQPCERGRFRLRGSHPLWPVFPDRSTNVLVGNSSAAPYRGPVKAFNPEHTTHTGLAYVRFRLVPFRSPLLGESRLLSTPSGTEMFHF